MRGPKQQRNLLETATVWAKSERETEIDTFNKMLHSFQVDATRRVTFWHLMPNSGPELSLSLRASHAPCECECECENNPMKFASMCRMNIAMEQAPPGQFALWWAYNEACDWLKCHTVTATPHATATCNMRGCQSVECRHAFLNVGLFKHSPHKLGRVTWCDMNYIKVITL